MQKSDPRRRMHFTYYAKRRLIGEKIKNSSSPRKTELSKQWLYFFAWRPNWRSSNVGKRDASKEPTPSIFESKGSAFKFYFSEAVPCNRRLCRQKKETFSLLDPADTIPSPPSLGVSSSSEDRRPFSQAIQAKSGRRRARDRGGQKKRGEGGSSLRSIDQVPPVPATTVQRERPAIQ